jgi:FKBP-type peptidyl-prolyl cis-trans isomerase
MKLRMLAAVVAAVTMGPGLAFAQTAAPRPAQATAPAGPVDKTSLSYSIGFDLTDDLAKRNVDIDVGALVRGIQDGYARKEPTVAREKQRQLLDQFQQKMLEQAKAEFEKAIRENKAKSDAFLAANKSKPGVIVLPSGIQYRIVEPGTGAKPTSASTVALHVRASLPNGPELMSTHGNAEAPSFKMAEFPGVLPPSLKDIIMMMPAGSRWEVYLPPEKAFGNDPRLPFGPARAVVYELNVVSVK